MFTRNQFLVGAAVIGTSLAALWGSSYLGTHESQQASAPPSGAAPSGELPTPASARIRDRASSARGRTYVVDFQIEVDGSGEDDAETLAGAATLSLYELRTDAVGTTWVGVLEGATGALDGDAPVETIEARVRQFDVPFAFVVAPSGQVSGIGFPSGFSERGQSMARGVVAALQFVTSSSGASAWTVAEENSHGPCKATYERISTDRFKKTRSECSVVSASAAADTGIRTQVRSGVEVSLGEAGVVKEATSLESLEIQFPEGGDIVMTTKLELTLAGPVTRPNPHPEASRWTIGPLFAPAQKPRPFTPEESLRAKRELVRGLTFASVSGALDAAIAGGNESERLDGFARLSALFELEPASIAEAAAQLRSTIESSKAETIVAAFADSNSPAAQAEMNSLLEDPNVSEEVKGHVISHLGTHERPSVSTFETLEDLALTSTDPTMRERATLALGGAALHGGRNEETRAEASRATERLNTSYAQAPTPEQRALLMKALGNAGASSSLPMIESALKSEDPGVRADAVFSLRFVPGEAVDQLIVKTLVGDPDAGVRRAAAETFGYRDLSPVLEQGALAAYKADVADFVRHGVISFLCAKAPNLGTAAVEALKLATQDEDEQVRTSAAAALKSLS